MDGVGDIMCVVINMVFGVGGLFDVVMIVKLLKYMVDFGIMMGCYGMLLGLYFVLLLFGLSMLCDMVGFGVDYVGNLFIYVKLDGLSWGLFGVNFVNMCVNLFGVGDVLDVVVFDKYLFVCNVYL